MHAARSLGAALLALAVTTLSAKPREVTATEEWLFDRINGLPDILEWPLWVVMQLGAALAIPALALLAFVIWRRLRPGLDLVVAGTIAWLCAKVMKGLLERGRPASFFDDVNLRGSPAPTTWMGSDSPPATWPWPSPSPPSSTRT